MVAMPDKGISSIKYNFLNLPNNLILNKNGSENLTINTKYRADGTKLTKENVTSITGVIGATITKKTTDYLDGFQYLKTENINGGGSSEMLMVNSLSRRAMQPMAFSLVPTLPDPTIDPPFGGGGIIVDVKTPDLQFFPTEEGFYDYQKNQYIYQMKDQLGNVRLSFGKNSTGALEITDVNDYYPFGMNHLKSGNSMFAVGSYKAYKYGNKELQEFGAYDFEARTFWQDIPRMGQIDPLAEKMPSWSPYAYSFNNPIRYGDPTGMEPEEAYKPTPKEAITFNAAGVGIATKYLNGKNNSDMQGWFGGFTAAFRTEGKINAYIMRTDPLNNAQSNSFLMPDVNGKRHYIMPTTAGSIYNGHSMDNMLKEFGINSDKYKR